MSAPRGRPRSPPPTSDLGLRWRPRSRSPGGCGAPSRLGDGGIRARDEAKLHYPRYSGGRVRFRRRFATPRANVRAASSARGRRASRNGGRARRAGARGGPDVLDVLRPSAADRRDRPLDCADHVGDADLVGGPRERVPALHAPPACDELRVAQVERMLSRNFCGIPWAVASCSPLTKSPAAASSSIARRA